MRHLALYIRIPNTNQKGNLCKGNENENLVGCEIEQILTPDFSEKSLSRVCPQIEDSLFAAIYILRPLNVL